MKIAFHLTFFLVMIAFVAPGQRRETDFFSKALSETQNIWTHLPENYDSSKTYGVLYVLDADGHFDYMSRFVDYLSKPFAKVIPELIVVGVRSKSPAYRFKNFTLLARISLNQATQISL